MSTDQKFYKAVVGTMVSNGINKFRFTTPVVRVRNPELVELLSNSTSAEEITREEAFEMMPDMYREVEFEEKKAEELKRAKRAEAERLAAIEAEKAGGENDDDQKPENEDDGQPIVAKATKHEWLEDLAAPQAFTVNATRNVAGGTLVLTSTSGVKAGMVFGFRSALGASKTVQLRVTSVTDGTDLAVTVYAGSTDVQLVATDVAFLIGSPKNESSDPSADSGYEPTAKFNYTQIFDRTAKVSKTSEAVKIYGIESALNYQVKRQLMDLAYETKPF